jgi:alkanesulfonate monooxygenase SsuD/methylene tetrahydromethanopterin reductase-like flavin-dependent oxidoreductase (luciferase family)
MILTASFGSAVPPAGFSLSHYQAIVAAVERAGIDAALFVRSTGSSAPMLDAVPLIAALASVPASIGLGASIPVDYTEPFHLARAFAAIDRLTRGRGAVVFDLAAGIDLAAAVGRSIEAADRAARILEFFETTTELWDSWEDDAILVNRPEGLFTDANKIHRINHDGTYYAVRGPLNAPRPIQGWPVVFVPVASVEASAIAARVADVALIPAATPDIARRASKALREHADAFGRRGLPVLADVVPILGATVAKAQEMAGMRANSNGDTLRFVGTPEQFAAMLRDWHDAGVCEGFNLLPRPIPEEINLLADCVRVLDRPRPAEDVTLRDRLGLSRPLSRYAA